MTSWIMGTCKANGIDVHYLRTGGNKPPIVLLHGLMTNGACWTSLAQVLEKDYDVVMPDARGHGNSSAPDHGYHYDTLAKDAVSFIDALDLANPVILGHSMGGMTAAVIAAYYPKRVRGLILADPTFLTPQRQQEVYESDVANQHRRILNQPKDKYLAEIRSRPSRRPSDLVEVFAQARLQTSIHAFEILTPPNPDYLDLINQIKVPSLLIIGDTDAIISLDMATELTRINQRLQVVQIAKAGHSVPFDQPEHFSLIVQTFLRSFLFPRMSINN